MKFAAIKDIHQQNAMRTSQMKSDFLSRWLDANGTTFADGVLGELMENLNRLTDDAAEAAVQQQANEVCRGEIAQYINAAKMRDEAQCAQNETLSAECDALEQEIAALENQRPQLGESAEKVYQLVNHIPRLP